MKRDFIDELIDALIELKNSKKKISISIPPAPHEVFDVIVQVAKRHQITADEMKMLFGFRDLGKSERELLEDLENEEQ